VGNKELGRKPEYGEIVFWSWKVSPLVGMGTGSELEKEMGWLALKSMACSEELVYFFKSFDGVYFQWVDDGIIGWAIIKGAS